VTLPPVRGGDEARILVIRLGALGDFILSFGPFAAIRAHHPSAHITLLTTAPYADMARRAPWFDAVVLDERPPPWHLAGLLRLRRRLRGYDLVYDLQTSDRSSGYFRLAGKPAWSGIARGCSLPHANPGRNAMHSLERQREQLEMAGVAAFPPPELDWLTEPPLDGLPARAALLVPGAAPHRPAKRWPIGHFAALAEILAARGYAPVVVGSAVEAALARQIPAALDLTGRTSLPQLAAIAARAALAVGNDTGPMHLAAAVGCRSVVLFSAESDPALTAPRLPDGGWPTVLRVADLADLTVERVAAAVG
jgi:ADP-heptose:LPS heptosyltransferase